MVCADDFYKVVRLRYRKVRKTFVIFFIKKKKKEALFMYIRSCACAHINNRRCMYVVIIYVLRGNLQDMFAMVRGGKLAQICACVKNIFRLARTCAKSCRFKWRHVLLPLFNIIHSRNYHTVYKFYSILEKNI